MSTDAQIEANRLNTQHSTGPVTSDGKEVAAQNAVKHGLRSAKPLASGEDPAEYTAFALELIADLKPVGMAQRILAEPDRPTAVETPAIARGGVCGTGKPPHPEPRSGASVDGKSGARPAAGPAVDGEYPADNDSANLLGVDLQSDRKGSAAAAPVAANSSDSQQLEEDWVRLSESAASASPPPAPPEQEAMA